MIARTNITRRATASEILSRGGSWISLASTASRMTTRTFSARGYRPTRYSWRTQPLAASFASSSVHSSFVSTTCPPSPITFFLVQRNFSSTNVVSDNYPPHTLFPMPALSPTMETGTISKWAKSEGEEFSAGDVLCEIETDKATLDFEAQDDGIIAKILKQGDAARDLPVGVPICVVVDEMGDVEAFKDYVAEEGGGAAAAAATDSKQDPGVSAAPPERPEADASAASIPKRDVAPEHALFPSARHLSESRGLDATVLQGSGKGGRVTKGDVLKAIADGTNIPALGESKKMDTANTKETKADDSTKAASKKDTAQAAAPPSSSSKPATPPSSPSSAQVNIPQVDLSHGMTYEDIPNSNMRKVIARRLTESKRDVPHFYTSIEVELDQVLTLRKYLATQHDVKVSVNDVIIRSAALALRDVPEVNAYYNAKKNSLSLHENIDVSVAVATPTGLITPIVLSTNELGLSEISAKVKDLASRARDGKLKPEEYQGGTFCISNLGMFGVDEFSAVINPPQAAILAVGGGTRRAVPTPYNPEDKDATKVPPSIKTIMTARLSADRRVVDEATAGLFLSAFRHYLSKPDLLLL